MDSTDFHSPSFWLQLIVFAAGCAGVVFTIWRTSIGVQSKLEFLAGNVKEQNGYVREHAKELAKLRERISIQESLTERDREIANRPT